MVRRVL